MKRIFLLASAVLILGGCKVNTYQVKNVEVLKKEAIIKNSDYPDCYIYIKRGKKEARIQLETSDYNRIKEGQFIDAWIDNDSAYLQEYKINMEAK